MTAPSSGYFEELPVELQPPRNIYLSKTAYNLLYGLAILVSNEELAANQIAHNVRDCCAHLLLPLNRCRRRNYYLPYKCVDERHSYEACLYKDFQRRQKVLEWERKQKARANLTNANTNSKVENKAI